MDRIEAAKQRGIEDKKAGVKSTDNPFSALHASAEFNAWDEGHAEPLPIKRFAVFSWMPRESCGGMNDLLLSTDDIIEALSAMRKQGEDPYVEIYDIMTGAKIYDSENDEPWSNHIQAYRPTNGSKAAVQAYAEVATL